MKQYKKLVHYINVANYHILRLLFILQRDRQILRKFLAIAASHSLPIPLKDARFRSSLSSMDSWLIDPQHQSYFYSSIERFLSDYANQVPRRLWHLWLISYSALGRQIEPLHPITAQALLQAQHHGLLEILPQQDLDYLLQAYLLSYGQLLTDSPIKQGRQLLPFLIEYATLVQLTGATPEAKKVFQHWLANARILPRALNMLSDAEAFKAPIRGIGSPHGVCTAYYRDEFTHDPLRMTFAGTTGDRTLNAHLFACFFAIALACDSEPTILTLGGGIFTLKAAQGGGLLTTNQKPFSIVIGPIGPLEPERGVAPLGMTPQNAMMLTERELQEIQDDTGLLKIQKLDIGSAHALEAIVTRSLVSKQTSSELRSSPSESATGAIHMMPMLHRKPVKGGDIVPIEIEVPYSVLGSQKVFTLLRTTRSAYMQQLINTAERRLIFAEQIFREQDEKVKLWAQLSESDKQSICARKPYVLIHSSVDFELGIVIPFDPPEQIDYRQYEDEHRPQLRNSAHQQAVLFRALCQQLRELNRQGGRADAITFKLLIDAMIRRAPFPISSAEFQLEYQNWVEICAAPVWGVIEQWAIDRGLSPRVLAADNIIFNARTDVDKRMLVLQPWVMLDLHDYVISINNERGLMEVQPLGRTARIDELLYPDLSLNVTDLRSLHDSYCNWISSKLGLEQRNRKEQEVQSIIFSDPDISIFIQLQLVKDYLFRGNVTNAQQIIDRLKKQDRAVIYFWGAIIQEFVFLSNFAGKPDGIIDLEWRNILSVVSISIIRNALGKHISSVEDKVVNTLDMLRPFFGDNVDKIAPDALPYVRQVRATKDIVFMQSLLREESSDGLEWETIFTNDETRQRYFAAQHVLSSLQYLRLAEMMKEQARLLSFTQGLSTDISREIRKLQVQTETIPFVERFIVEQVSDLAEQFGKKSEKRTPFVVAQQRARSSGRESF